MRPMAVCILTPMLRLRSLARATFAAGLFAATAFGTTWIGTVSDQHCTPDHKALSGDDSRCIVFIANDKQVYTIENQDAVKPHVGHEVSLTGTLNEEMIIGISYESQGIIHVDSVRMLKPIEIGPEEQKEFQTWMKGMQPEVTAVRNAIVAKNNAEVATEGAKLAASFELITDFWQKQHNENALQFAIQARDSAKTVSTATTQIEQILALRKVQEACSSCHLAHRAGKPGSFTLQQ
jgi:hypothetical protein